MQERRRTREEQQYDYPKYKVTLRQAWAQYIPSLQAQADHEGITKAQVAKKMLQLSQEPNPQWCPSNR